MWIVWKNFYNYEGVCWLLKGGKGQIKVSILLYYPCNVSKCFLISGFKFITTFMTILMFLPIEAAEPWVQIVLKLYEIWNACQIEGETYLWNTLEIKMKILNSDLSLSFQA